jgi:hypothetical protein
MQRQKLGSATLCHETNLTAFGSVVLARLFRSWRVLLLVTCLLNYGISHTVVLWTRSNLPELFVPVHASHQLPVLFLLPHVLNIVVSPRRIEIERLPREYVPKHIPRATLCAGDHSVHEVRLNSLLSDKERAPVMHSIDDGERCSGRDIGNHKNGTRTKSWLAMCVVLDVACPPITRDGSEIFLFLLITIYVSYYSRHCTLIL